VIRVASVNPIATARNPFHCNNFEEITIMFGRNRGVSPEAMIQAIEEAKPVPQGAVVGRDGIRRLIRPNLPGRDHSADSVETQRERRRKGLSVVLDERLSLEAELDAALGDLPARISADRRASRWVAPVGEAVASIATALREIARAVHTSAPEWPALLSAGEVADGTWTAALTEAARGLDGPVRAALGSSGRPGLPGRRAAGTEDTLSDAVLAQLREIDRAVRTLDSYVRRVQASEAPTTPPLSQAAVQALDPMAELRRRHSAEQRELRERQAAEWQEASAAVKAARLDQVARA
jgi:hypothetical protein